MKPHSVLVIGASRGLGLEFVRQYAAAGCEVVGTVRKKIDLKKLTAHGARALVYDAVKSPLAAFLSRAAANADLVIYNAGVYGNGNGVAQATRASDFNPVMLANVFGALRLMPILGPQLAARKATMVFISSSMGSLAQTTAGNGVVYRASKAALNMVMKTAAAEFGPQGLVTFALHPGWVRTDMGGPNAMLDPQESVEGMRRVIAQSGPAATGGFFDYAGQPVVW